MTPKYKTNDAYKLSSYFNFQGATISTGTLLLVKLEFVCMSFKDRVKRYRLVLQGGFALDKNELLKTIKIIFVSPSSGNNNNISS